MKTGPTTSLACGLGVLLVGLLFAVSCFAVILARIRLRLRTLGPSVPPGGEFVRSVGVLSGKVVLLGAIGFEVVQLPSSVAAEGDELPIADTNSGVPFVFPEDRISLDRFVGERRDEAATFQRLNLPDTNELQVLVVCGP